MPHHTKDKGDIGLAAVIADLTKQGVLVALPLSEHLPWDCIAVGADGSLVRLSVKYRQAKNGSLIVAYRSSWSNSKGVQSRRYKKTEFDATAVYCPDTDECYYVRNREVAAAAFYLRVTDSPYGRSVRRASDYRDPNRLFG